MWYGSSELGSDVASSQKPSICHSVYSLLYNVLIAIFPENALEIFLLSLVQFMALMVPRICQWRSLEAEASSKVSCLGRHFGDAILSHLLLAVKLSQRKKLVRKAHFCLPNGGPRALDIICLFPATVRKGLKRDSYRPSKTSRSMRGHRPRRW